MFFNFKFARISWFIMAVGGIVAGSVGVLEPNIYDDVVSKGLIPAAVGQDIITVALSVVLFWIACVVKPEHVRTTLVALGIVGYDFYGYGIYVIEQVYNEWYFVYLVVWLLSFWSLVSIRLDGDDAPKQVSLPHAQRVTSIVISVLQPLVFIPMWIVALVGLIREHNRVEYLFSVYIIDLVWVMPAFLMVSWSLLRSTRIGLLLTPSLFIVGFGIIFSLCITELVKSWFDQPMMVSALWQSLALSVLFLAGAVSHLSTMRFKEKQRQA